MTGDWPPIDAQSLTCRVAACAAPDS